MLSRVEITDVMFRASALEFHLYSLYQWHRTEMELNSTMNQNQHQHLTYIVVYSNQWDWIFHFALF